MTTAQFTCATFTMSRNEKLWLGVWLNHYANELGQEACYVICEPDDMTIVEAKQKFPDAHFIEEPSGKRVMTTGHYDLDLELWRLDVVKRWQTQLLNTYECVIFSDTDELLCPEEGILNYCMNILIPSGVDRIRSECWQPVQQADEPDIDRTPGEPALKDRSKMWRLPGYDKTLMARKPQAYARGFHFTYGHDGTGVQLGDGTRKRILDPVDPRLPMVHMWRADFNDWLEDNSWRIGATKEQGKEYFKTHIPFFDTYSKKDAEGEAQPIPAEWKKMFKLP